MENCKVTIIVPTYNHEKYIEQCLDSLLAQKTNFDFTILIGEDGSKDKTRQICQQYANKHPNKINLILQDRKNVIKINGRITGRYNFLDLLSKAKTPYIAICEGDDYWVDDYKLQKQVDFLEQNPGFNICFTRAYLQKNNKKEPFTLPQISNQGVYTYDDLLRTYNFIATASVMIRVNKENFPDNEFPDWIKKTPYGDMALYLLTCKTQKIKCLPDFTTVYRIHDSGVWSGLSKLKQLESMLQFYTIIFKHLTPTQQQIVQQAHKATIKKMANIKGNRITRRLLEPYYRIKYKLK